MDRSRSGRRLQPRQRDRGLGRHGLEDGRAREQVELLRVEARSHLRAEVRRDEAVPAGDATDGRGRARVPAERERREVGRRGPALGLRGKRAHLVLRRASIPSAARRAPVSASSRASSSSPTSSSCRPARQRASGSPGSWRPAIATRNPAGRWSRMAARTSRLVGFVIRCASSSTRTAGRRHRCRRSSSRGTPWCTGWPGVRSGGIQLGRPGMEHATERGVEVGDAGSPGRCRGRRAVSQATGRGSCATHCGEHGRLAVPGAGDERRDRRPVAVDEPGEEPGARHGPGRGRRRVELGLDERVGWTGRRRCERRRGRSR